MKLYLFQSVSFSLFFLYSANTKIDQDSRLSSYESLNHCTLETLYNRRHNEKRTCIYVSSTDININDTKETVPIKTPQGYYEEGYYQKSEDSSNKNSSRSNLNHIEITDAYQQQKPKMDIGSSNVFASECTEENDDDRKQKELSDWYYIKTSSKPKSTSYIKNLSPYVRRKVMMTNNNLSNHSNSSNNIYHHHHGSAKNLDKVVTKNEEKTNNYVPVPAVRKFPPKSPVSYARKCYNNNNIRKKQQTTCSLLTARIGEITSSSFEHVPSAITSTSNNIGNAFTFQSEIAPEKQFSNNSLDVKAIRIHQQQQQQLHNNIDDSMTKYMDARRRPLPLIPNMPPPPSSTPPPIQKLTEQEQQQTVCVHLFQFVFVLFDNNSCV